MKQKIFICLALLLMVAGATRATNYKKVVGGDIWNSTNPTTLANYLYNYTVEALTELKEAGADPFPILCSCQHLAKDYPEYRGYRRSGGSGTGKQHYQSMEL